MNAFNNFNLSIRDEKKLLIFQTVKYNKLEYLPFKKIFLKYSNLNLPSVQSLVLMISYVDDNGRMHVLFILKLLVN